MLLTEVRLTRDGARFYRDVAAAHRAVVAITDQPDTRVLWAMPRPDLLVIQHHRPLTLEAFSRLNVWEHRTTNAPTTPPTGVPIRYGVIVNPTRQDNHTRRRDPIPPEDLPAWVERKLGDALNLGAITTEYLPTVGGRRGPHRVTHHRVMVTGTATVKNHEALAHHQAAGVGRGKAYGCGLLLIRGNE